METALRMKVCARGFRRAHHRGKRMATARAYPTTGTRKKKKKRKNRTLLFSLVFLVLGGLAVLAYQLIFSAQAATVSMTMTPIATTSTYINTGDGLLYQTDGKIHFYHLTDTKKNYTYGMGASDIRMSGSSSMTVVFNEASLQVVGEKDTLTFGGSIKEVECGKSHLAVLRRSAEGAESVIVLTQKGEQVTELTFADQYILDFGFYKTTGEMLWVETLNVNTGTPTTTITTYDLTKREITGVIYVQGQLVDELFITDKSLFVEGTNQIIRYTHDGNKEVYRTMIYGYRVADFSNASGTPTFLLTPRGGDFHSVKIITLNEDSEAGRVETYLQVPTEGVSALIMNNRLIVASRESLYTYTLKGKLSTTATFEQPIDNAVKLSDSKLLLSSNGMYYISGVS